jgi:prefoldin subunit 5
MPNPHCADEWQHYEESLQAFDDAWPKLDEAWEEYDEKLTDMEEYLQKAEDAMGYLEKCFKTQHEALAEPDNHGDEDAEDEIHPHLCTLEQIAYWYSYMELVHDKQDELIEKMDKLDKAEKNLQVTESKWLEAITLAEYCEQHWAGKPWLEG